MGTAEISSSMCCVTGTQFADGSMQGFPVIWLIPNALWGAVITVPKKPLGFSFCPLGPQPGAPTLQGMKAGMTFVSDRSQTSIVATSISPNKIRSFQTRTYLVAWKSNP